MNRQYKVYDLQGPVTQQDLDWMYTSNIDIEVRSPYEDGDSGWCDMSTGQQIITNSHKFTAYIKNDEEDMWLKLYWEDRAKLSCLIESATYKYEDAN